MIASSQQTEQVIIGTAGHIDHGKTALVKALTGIDADTLAEEKRRGITIELGFVFMDAPGFDKQIVFIDVPGHERLIKTMVAGASNIDAALLVIAANEGINAQTLEHLDILQLLGIESGIIALTKTDLVDAEQVHVVSGEIRQFVTGTFLQDAPVICVSSVTGAGVNEIRSALLSVARNAGARRDSGVFRMPIDRVFTMPGFGTVIAGTILSGRVGVGDRVEIFPDGIMGRVRTIQVHNQDTQESHIGRRTAINLPDIKKDALRRGQCAAAAGSLAPTNRLDARLHLLASYGKELKNRARLRLHIGTDEVISRLALLERDRLLPGETALVQFVMESPIVALPKDRFVVRNFSPPKTIGGGVILDAKPEPHKRFDAETVQALKSLEGSSINEVVEQMFAKSRFIPQSPTEVALSIGESECEVAKAVKALHETGKLVRIASGVAERSTRTPDAGRYMHDKFYQDLAQKFLNAVEAYFGKYPYRLLMPLADLQSQFVSLADRQVFEAIVRDLCGKGTICEKDAKLGLAGRQIRLKPGEQELADRIEETFREAGFAAPLEEDVREEARVAPQTFENIVNGLIDQGSLVRLNEKVTYHRDCLQRAQGIVTEYIRKGKGITVAELRDELGVSRKYALAILEHFDKIGLTRREGDGHVMRAGGRV